MDNAPSPTQPPASFQAAELAHFSERIRCALETRTPLRIRGGGSKDFYGHSLQGELLDTRALTGIVNYEPSELVVTVRAGTPLAELQAQLAAQGQCLAFEPPHFGAATVGGMVAAGWSGPARASVGAVRDFVLGLEMINGQGQVLRYGGQVMKNVAGYDVSRLMAGSWGTLGLLTELSLKVMPVATAEATLRFECTQDEALQRLNDWGGQPLPLNASCWLPQPGHRHGAGILYLRLRGAQAAVHAACLRLGGERLDDKAAAGDWEACREQRLPWFVQRAPEHCLWRLSVPQSARPLSLPEGAQGPLIEWHGALRWVQAARAQGDELRALAAAAGGSATLFRAENPGDIGSEAVFDYGKTAAVALLQERLKKAFDPSCVLNRGRLTPLW